MQLLELFRYDFMRYALISGLLLGPTCALLGVFVNLRGMAFFSDALAHSALTGVALGFMIDAATGWKLDPTIYVLIFSCLLALGMGIWTLACLGCAAAPNFEVLILCRALVGVGEASFVSLATPFIGTGGSLTFPLL